MPEPFLVVHELRNAHQPVRGEHQTRQQGALLPGADRDDLAADDNLDWAQNPDLHATCPTSAGAWAQSVPSASER